MNDERLIYLWSIVMSGSSFSFSGREGQQVSHFLYPKSLPKQDIRVYVKSNRLLKWYDTDQIIRPLLASVASVDEAFRVEWVLLVHQQPSNRP